MLFFFPPENPTWTLQKKVGDKQTYDSILLLFLGL